MEIGAIPGIRLVPAVKSPPANPQLSAIFDIEHSSEPADDSYSGNRKPAAGGGNGEEEISPEEQLGKDQAPDPTSGPASSIDLIA